MVMVAAFFSDHERIIIRPGLINFVKLPCYLFSRELNIAKTGRAYFAGLKFRDLAKKIHVKELNFAKIVEILVCINKQ